MITKEIIQTPIGLIQIKSLDDCVFSVKFIDKETQATKLNSTASISINNYFKGKSTTFNIHHTLIGTPFQKAVWLEIEKIPYGVTATYSEIAKAIGKPQSFRAVANVCGQNKLALIIPCHRVVGKINRDGYKFGSERKRWLLKFESNE